jgi:hypothetical protein
MKTGWGILGVAALVAATLPAAGCSTACPAIGYVSTIEVRVEGNTAAVHEVQLCTDEGCSAPEPTPAPAPTVAIAEGWVPLPNGGFSPAPGPGIPPPTYPEAPFLSFRPSAGKWAFRPAGARNSTPDRVTLRALAQDGAVLAEQENDLVWTKTDPFNPCGSPVATPPIVFLVGAR